MWPKGGNVRVDGREISKRIEARHSLVAKGISAFMVVWVLAAVASLAGVAALIYIVLHFVAKFW